MPLDPRQQNSDYFSKHVRDFTKDYFDNAERFIVKNFFKGKKILVLGCGTGRTLVPLHKMGYEVTGIDINPNMVKKAKTKVRKFSIPIYLMDAARLKFPKNSFDTVFFPYHGIDYVYPDIFKAVLETRRVLKPDGVFVFNSHNRLNLKALPRFFEGKYTNYYGLITYRISPWDVILLRKYFKKIIIFSTTSILTTWKQANLKEKINLLFPFFDPSLYFVCKK